MRSLSSDSSFSPFNLRSFRYQWFADLAVSWAFEMEVILLGWFVLVETQSVALLAIFASLQYIGTLFSPLVGMQGDRFGHGVVLGAMRAFYASMAAVLLILVTTDQLTPTWVFFIAGLTGLLRPSDMVMRYALVGANVPGEGLTRALGLSRATMDSARVAGALAGAGIVAWVGMAPAYVVITVFYAVGVILTRMVSAASVPAKTRRSSSAAARPSIISDLKDALAHVWQAPHLKAGLLFAFFLNLTAFPIVNGLLPYVAKEIYQADQQTLSYMVATQGAGALAGALLAGRIGSLIHPARLMMIAGVAWYVVLLCFALQRTSSAGLAALFAAGCAQTLCTVPLSALLVRTSQEQYRGRVMGLRAMAIYGLPIGLWVAGPLISAIGFRETAIAYCMLGLALAGWLGWTWRKHLGDGMK